MHYTLFISLRTLLHSIDTVRLMTTQSFCDVILDPRVSLRNYFFTGKNSVGARDLEPPPPNTNEARACSRENNM